MSIRHRRHANPFSLQAGPNALPPPQVAWPRAAPVALDIGCGAGAFTQALAQAHPEWNVLGLEIRPHLVAQLNAQMAAYPLPNGQAVLANANMHIGTLVAPRSVALVAVNFPDPWYKKRHHKRRVVSAEWLSQLAPYLQEGAELHAMTDYAPVALSIEESLQACGLFVSAHPEARFAATSTTGISSEREVKHMQRGEPIWRLQATYCAPIAAGPT